MKRVHVRLSSFGLYFTALVAVFLACAQAADDDPAAVPEGCACKAKETAQCECPGGTHSFKTCATTCKTWTSCACGDAGSTGGKGGSAGKGGSSGSGGKGGTASGGKSGSGGTGASAGTGASDGGPGCVVAAAEDKCPGAVMTLTGSGTEPRTGSATGMTTGVCADYKSSCQKGTPKDVVYQVTSDCDGELSAEASQPAMFEPVLYARSDCTDAATELGCVDIALQDPAIVKFPVVAGQVYYLFITGPFGGKYALDAKVICAVCGNGVTEGVEQCDDNNSNDNDGCSKACKLESAGPADHCDGDLLTLVDAAGTMTATATGDTTLLYAQYAGSCGMTEASAEVVYQINTGSGGKLTATLEKPATGFDTVMYIRSGSCAHGTELGCVDIAGNGGESMILDVQPNQDLWLFVDGRDSERGPYALKVTIKP